MKPDWKDAPEWAKWLAMDYDGDWWWFELEPHVAHRPWGREWQNDGGQGLVKEAYRHPTLPDMGTTLEPRP